MTQITINIENQSILPHLKKILAAIDGVSIAKSGKVPQKSGIEEAIEDARTGRVTHYNNADEMFRAFGI